MPGEVHDHQHAGARRELALGVREVDQAGGRLGVDQHGRGAEVRDRVGAGDECQRWDENLVAGTHAEHAQRERQPGGARVQAAHVGTPM